MKTDIFFVDGVICGKKLLNLGIRHTKEDMVHLRIVALVRETEELHRSNQNTWIDR